MKTPEIIADCVAEMMAKTPRPVSVKTRIALSDTAGDGFSELFHLTDLITQAGCRHIIVHARKAKLNLSPKDNRQKLPLNYDVVYRLKRSFPDIFITINGNILSLTDVQEHLHHTDGVMIGRWAYGNPYALAQVDHIFYNDNHPVLTRHQVLESFFPYLEAHSDKLSIILPHLMGLFHGEPNARHYKAALATRDLSVIKDFLNKNTPE